MPFIPNSQETLNSMLKDMGYSTFEELYNKAVPKDLQFDGHLEIPDALTEMEVTELLKYISSKNTNTDKLVNFIGAGIYDHYIPAIVERITSRPEFYTAYTPYQAEVSQGTLTAIFEFQSMITALTGMEVANASVYDGGSAIAEAINLAIASSSKKRILVSTAIHPLYKRVIESYKAGCDVIFDEIPLDKNGLTDISVLEEKFKQHDDIACFVLQNPNFFGNVEDGFAFGEILSKQKKALFIASVDPISLGFLTPPGEYGADIAVGEAQSLGNRMNFGGPNIGFFAAKKEYVRQMPGRIAGVTEDVDGKRGLVLTYQTREQHIRRAKATSNICSNQQLLALAATVYLSLLGDTGIKETAELCFNKAHYMADKLSGIDGVEMLYPKTVYFREFAVKLPIPACEVVEQMAYRGYLAGADLGRFKSEWKNYLLIALTEKRTKEQIDEFCEILAEGLK